MDENKKSTQALSQDPRSEIGHFGPLSIDAIMEYLPHAYPFLLVDHIKKVEWVHVFSGVPLEVPVGTVACGYKNMTISDPIFQGHFPFFPVVPGVLLLETMAQVSIFCAYPSFYGQMHLMPKMRCQLIGINQSRFRRPVRPGDQFIVSTKVVKYRKGYWTLEACGFVGEEITTEAEIFARMWLE